MIPLVFTFAAIFIIVGIALFAVDHRRRTARSASAERAGSSIPSAADAAPREMEPAQDEFQGELAMNESATDAPAVGDNTETVSAADSHVESSSTRSVDEDGVAGDTSAAEVSSDAPAHPAQPARRHLSNRKVRHLRKLWAQQRNATYSRVDHELPSYWQRTPDGDAKAVVSGFAFGREMHLADIGGIATIAIRRCVATSEVFELRRGGGTDLPYVATEAGLIVAATDPELIHRIFDDRASRMLVDVHPAICRMWCEGAWSLAQLVDGAVAEDWEGALVSLSGFSDIVRRLPPVEGEAVVPDASQWDPTRAQLTAQSADVGSLGTASTGRGYLQVVPDAQSNVADAQSTLGSGPTVVSQRGAGEAALDVEELADIATPDNSETSDTAGDGSQATSQSNPAPELEAIDSSSWRPARETPLDPAVLPTRSTARKMGAGAVESEELGESGQNIPALGEDPEHSRIRSDQGRVVRSNVKPASIFTDVESEPDSAGD